MATLHRATRTILQLGGTSHAAASLGVAAQTAATGQEILGALTA